MKGSSKEPGPLPRFGKTTRRLRKKHGLTLEQFAARVGTHKGYLSSIENGMVHPPMSRLVRNMARVLKVDEKQYVALAYIERAPELVRQDFARALAHVFRTDNPPAGTRQRVF